MQHFESIRLVTFFRHAALCLCFAGIVACGNDDTKEPEQEVPTKTSAPSAAELTSAKPLAGNEAVVQNLLYRVKAGDVFHYKFIQNDRLVQDGLTAITKQNLFYTKTIKSVKADGTVEMTVRYDSIRLENDYPDLRDTTKRTLSSYNSTNKEDRANREFNQYNGIVGEDVTLLVSKDGRISEISGLTPLLSKIFGAMKDSLNLQMQEQALEQIKMQLYMRPLQQEYQNYPDGGNVDSSKQWARSERSPLSGAFLVDNTITYTLNSVKNVGSRKAAYIGAKLVSTISNVAPKQGTLAFKLHKSEISGAGESVIDVEKGYTIMKSNSIKTMIDATMTDTKTKQSKRAMQLLNTSLKIELLR